MEALCFFGDPLGVRACQHTQFPAILQYVEFSRYIRQFEALSSSENLQCDKLKVRKLRSGHLNGRYCMLVSGFPKLQITWVQSYDYVRNSRLPATNELCGSILE